MINEKNNLTIELTPAENTALLRLLRKIELGNYPQSIKRIAKSLFALLTRYLYDK